MRYDIENPYLTVVTDEIISPYALLDWVINGLDNRLLAAWHQAYT